MLPLRHISKQIKNMNRPLLFLIGAMAYVAADAQTTLSLTLTSAVDHEAAPVVVGLDNYGNVCSAQVMLDGKEAPCQLDDLNQDGRMDELSFVADMKQGKARTATLTLMADGMPRAYPARTYAEIVLRNPKVKDKNKHDIYLQSITLDRRTTNPYQVLHHHGVAFENELIAMRVYMDPRQTVDLYGKRKKGLEIADTQFYTSTEQKSAGFGDDVLWVGNSFGLGAIRGWDGVQPTMLDNVNLRTQRILAQGPVRTIIEVEDQGWVMQPGTQPINMVIRYTLYAGHRDFDVDVRFNRDMTATLLSTGFVHVKNSTEYSDHRGIRGCWGTDWPSTDTLNWKRETVGLGIHIPKQYLVSELKTDNVNYTFVVSPQGSMLHYSLAYTSDNETYGYHSADQWFGWLKAWRYRKENPVKVVINK